MHSLYHQPRLCSEPEEFMGSLGNDGSVPVPLALHVLGVSSAALDLARGTHIRGPTLYQQRVEACKAAAAAGSQKMLVLTQSLQSMCITPAAPAAGTLHYHKQSDACKCYNSDVLSSTQQLRTAPDMRNSLHVSSPSAAAQQADPYPAAAPAPASTAMPHSAHVDPGARAATNRPMATVIVSSTDVSPKAQQGGCSPREAAYKSRALATISSSCTLTSSTLLPPTANVWLEQVCAPPSAQ